MSLQDRLNKNKAKLGLGTKSSESAIVDKFKKRSTTTLEKTYDDRDKQTKSGGMGKTIFDPEMLIEYGLEEWQPHQTVGDHFFDIMPVSFDPLIPYCFETLVHFAVGFAKDQYICPHHSHRKTCYRCEAQSKLYRKKEEMLKIWSEERFKDAAKRLYPRDRVIFLIWKRTEELLQDEPSDLTLRLWNAPKEAVHKEIQAKVRDKINRTTLDISDISPNGEGRTVGMEIAKNKTSAGTFPGYSAFELHPREKPIPKEILEQLNKIIIDADENGFNNAIEMFIHFPTYEEIKESMLTEEDDDEKTPTASDKKSSLKQQLQSKDIEDDNNKTENYYLDIDSDQ